MLSERATSDEYRQARSYWHQRYLTNYPVLRLPADFPEKRLSASKAQRLDLDIAEDVVKPIHETCKIKGWSRFTVFVAAYKLMLYRISGQTDFVVGLPTAEQPLIGQNDLVGHCVNLVPLWCPVDASVSHESDVRSVQDALIEAYDNQIYTFVDLLNEKEMRLNTLGTAPLPAGLTTVIKYGPDDLVVKDATVDYFANPRAFESFEVYFNVIESPHRFELKWPTCSYPHQ